MTQSAQQRFGKVFPHELDAEGQSATVLATRRGYGRGAAEIVRYRESSPVGVIQQYLRPVHFLKGNGEGWFGHRGATDYINMFEDLGQETAAG